MARTNTQIARIAQASAGATRLITNLETDTTPEAGTIRDLLPQFRDELLESFDWHFARRRTALALLADVTRTDWLYAYEVPADMLSADRIAKPGDRNPSHEDLIPFRIEAGDGDPAAPEDDPAAAEPASSILLCDQVDAELLYTATVTNPARFSALFASALAWRLAYHLALHVTKKADLAGTAREEFYAAIGRAQVHSRNQGTADDPPPPDFLEGFVPLDTDPLSRFR